MIWPGSRSLDAQRRRVLKRVAAGPLRDYLGTGFPGDNARCDAVEIIALDLETTGLNPRTDRILSIGMVTVRALAVRLDSTWQRLVRSGRPIPEQTAVLHRITDDRSAQGSELAQVLPEVLERLAGRVMLAHHAGLEQAFLDQACRHLYAGPFLIPIIDTEALARRQLERRGQPFRPADLRLFNLREARGLPRYAAHNALSDAMATAELFLALLPDDACRLGDVLR